MEKDMKENLLDACEEIADKKYPKSDENMGNNMYRLMLSAAVDAIDAYEKLKDSSL